MSGTRVNNSLDIDSNNVFNVRPFARAVLFADYYSYYRISNELVLFSLFLTISIPRNFVGSFTSVMVNSSLKPSTISSVLDSSLDASNRSFT